MITEIGALVGIIKTLLDATKTGFDLLGKKPAAVESVKKTQERLAGIADQLFQSVALLKMLPVWLNQSSDIDFYAKTLTEDDVKLLDSKLRRLIKESNHDYFSATFFQTSFAVLPGVNEGITQFRARLLALEQDLKGITRGDAIAWRRKWPELKIRLNDLQNEAQKLENLADDIHSKLVTELGDASAA